MDWISDDQGKTRRRDCSGKLLPVHVFGRKPTRRTVKLSSKDCV